MKALGISEGDEVITAANTFIATSEAITMTGAKVVFVDCNNETCNLYVIRIKNREMVKELLAEKGIATGIH